MSDDSYAERRELTFEQAEGAAPLPAQLQLREISKELRALLWLIVFESLKVATIQDTSGYSQGGYFRDNWAQILYDYHVLHEHRMANEADHCLHFLDVPDEVCKARLRARNAAGTHDFAASDAEFDLITSYFVPPSEAEGFRIVRR